MKEREANAIIAVAKHSKAHSITDKFWRGVQKTDSCWLWTGSKQPNGYGYIHAKYNNAGRVNLKAHRVAYELLVGPIPDGLVIDHLCNNRGCVNPEHLRPSTNRDNVLRGASPCAKNAAKTHCKRGHSFSLDNTYVRPSGERECLTCRSIFKRALRSIGITEEIEQ